MSNNVLKLSVNAGNLDESGANAPVLTENMIPVYYDETNSVWRKADNENASKTYKWYDYDNKMWANAVTVTDTNRSTYLKAKAGTEISMNDINTMWVWIPRYTYTYLKNNTPQEIGIKFESGTSSSGTIKCSDAVTGTSSTSEICTDTTNGSLKTGTSTYTHPAFWWDKNDNNIRESGEELKGIWVGKFEVSSDTVCTVSNYVSVGSGCNLQTIRPKIVPNVKSWRGAQVGTFFNGIYKMRESGNQYGFSISDETHMMMNMEWGAVAYLSHSKYGINKEIAINAENTYTTGCGPQSVDSTTSGATCNAYNTDLGQSASTTGNVYGIYDLNGGSWEYVAGDIVYSDGKVMSGDSATSTNYNSAFTGILYDSGKGTSFTGTYAFPSKRYYNKYSYGTNRIEYTRGKLGDATVEMAPTGPSGNWYSDYAYFASSTRPWFMRGGYHSNGINAGLFNFNCNGGYANTYNTTRAVLSNKIISNLDESGANKPVLTSNMIPVYYDSASSSWKKADTSNTNETYKWYDYDNKMWANAVTVTSANRETYLKATTGTEIPMNDINTMWVWIPRYTYTYLNTNTPEEIKIKFENGTESTGTIKCTDNVSGSGTTSQTCTDTTNGSLKAGTSTYTHPAFTFGNTELTGLWVGKFESSATELPTATSTDESTIIIKPNVGPLSYKGVSYQFRDARQMEKANNAYGFPQSSSTTFNYNGNLTGDTNNIDIHMMKNTEWGVVTYLYHSKYGRCTSGKCEELTINNCSDKITGIGADTVSADESSTTCTTDKNKYNGASGIKASTTGNVYGVYDMSGGLDEYVMGNMVNTSNQFFSQAAGNWSTTIYPLAKYYDSYTYNTSPTTYTRGRLGDATVEMASSSGKWYSDTGTLPQGNTTSSFNYPWFLRGGLYNDTTGAGAFNFNDRNGSSKGYSGFYDGEGTEVYSKFSFRVVLDISKE